MTLRLGSGSYPPSPSFPIRFRAGRLEGFGGAVGAAPFPNGASNGRGCAHVPPPPPVRRLQRPSSRGGRRTKRTNGAEKAQGSAPSRSAAAGPRAVGPVPSGLCGGRGALGGSGALARRRCPGSVRSGRETAAAAGSAAPPLEEALPARCQTREFRIGPCISSALHRALF